MHYERTGHEAVAKREVAKGLGEPRGGEAALVVLADHPGLEGGEEERGGDAREEAPELFVD